MNRARLALAKFLRQVRARPRLMTACFLGVLVYAALPSQFTASSRALVAWDFGAGFDLVLAWVMMVRASVDHMRWRARIEDDGAAAVLCLTVAAAVASLAAIVFELSGLGKVERILQGQHLALVATTFLASWLLVHTSFALHYAHAYYVALARTGQPPLEFPGAQEPVYLDFLYFAMVIGMTSQTADVALASARMRRLVMAHGLIAFAFNTTLLALAINLAASLLG